MTPDTNETSLLIQMKNAQACGKKVTVNQKAREWNVSKKTMSALFAGLEKKGYIAREGMGRNTVWTVLKDAKGNPYSPPKTEIIDGVRVTKAPPGYAHGYQDINKGATARPTQSDTRKAL